MNCSIRRYELYAIFITSLVVSYLPEAIGQAPVRVNGGNVSLTLTTGIAGGQLIEIANTASSLQYRRQARISKITVQTSCPGQKFNLRVVATGATKGDAAPEVILLNGNPAANFIQNIPRTGGLGRCTLQYTASAAFAQGNSTELGNDVHTITYTILAQ